MMKGFIEHFPCLHRPEKGFPLHLGLVDDLSDLWLYSTPLLEAHSNVIRGG